MPFIMPAPNAPLPPRANAGGRAKAQRWGTARSDSKLAVLCGPQACLQWVHSHLLYSGVESEVSWGHRGMRRTCKHTRSAQGCRRLAAVGSHRFAERRPVRLARVEPWSEGRSRESRGAGRVQWPLLPFPVL